MIYWLSLKYAVYLRAIIDTIVYRDLADNSVYPYNFQAGGENNAPQDNAMEA